MIKYVIIIEFEKSRTEEPLIKKQFDFKNMLYIQSSFSSSITNS